MPGRSSPQPAAHVQAAIERGLGAGRGAPPAPTRGASAQNIQARSQPSETSLSAHVRAAIERGLGPRAQMRPPSASGAPADTPSHVRHAVDEARGGAVQARAARLSAAQGERNAIQARPAPYVTYTDVKSPTSPPPPPRWPVFSLSCAESGECSLRDLKTGRTRSAGDLYAGYVRVSAGGPIYVSPRPDVGLQGDSHPSIASVTPEERHGRGAIVAAGEVGFLGGKIVGHNDKTGHYRTRRNYWQSGMPAEKFHSFTEDPRGWYHADLTAKAKRAGHVDAATHRDGRG